MPEGLEVDAFIVRVPHRRRVDEARRVLVPVGVRRECSHRRAADADVVVLGMQRRERGQRPLGELALSIKENEDVWLVLMIRLPQCTLVGISAGSFQVT